jgi:hypothetical protein
VQALVQVQVQVQVQAQTQVPVPARAGDLTAGIRRTSSKCCSA